MTKGAGRGRGDGRALAQRAGRTSGQSSPYCHRRADVRMRVGGHAVGSSSRPVVLDGRPQRLRDPCRAVAPRQLLRPLGSAGGRRRSDRPHQRPGRACDGTLPGPLRQARSLITVTGTDAALPRCDAATALFRAGGRQRGFSQGILGDQAVRIHSITLCAHPVGSMRNSYELHRPGCARGPSANGRRP